MKIIWLIFPTSSISFARLLLVFLGLFAGLQLWPQPIHAQIAPYPVSTDVGSLTFDFGGQFQRGNGSDQWPLTWADDGEIYAAWGDGNGWDEQTRYFMGVTKISGNPPALSGIDVWGGNAQDRKPLGFVADASQTMYLFYTTPDDGWKGSYGSKSVDNGRTWPSSFPKVFDFDSDGVLVVGIAQFGPGYSNVPPGVDGSYFYVYLSGRWDAGKDGKGQDVFLGRVPKAQIFNRGAYEYFNGIVGTNNPIWSSDWATKKPVFHDSAGMAYHANVTYNPALQKFIYAKGQNTSDLGVFEGPTLWGPWKTIYYGAFKDSFSKFTFQFPQKWMSADGLTMWMSWSGWPEYDNVNFTKSTLTLKAQGGDSTPPNPPINLKITEVP